VKNTGRSAPKPQNINRVRRRLLGCAGGGIIAAGLGGLMSKSSRAAESETGTKVRWGFVGTGSIANFMGSVVRMTPTAELTAVSSRRMESAAAFAATYGAERAFDSWRDMAAWDGIDAVYVATPTSVREEISVAAADSGKHVLGEKPFASLDSLERIIAACRANGVGFMDGTHFAHHPRTAAIRETMAERIGRPWSVASAFQFDLADRGNIRYDPVHEPMGAIGDAGWYNMRAAVEYLSPAAELRSVDAYLRRDPGTGAAVGGSGVLVFDDESTSTWNCGFDSGAVVMDLRITGARGTINIDDFLGQDEDGSASYRYRAGGWGPDATDEVVRVASSLPGPALMFEDFAAMVADAGLRERWMQASERTQRLLDAVWQDALSKE
jgi:predicted dehydrogenase